MKRLLYIAILFMNISALAQGTSYSVAKDPEGDGKIFNGLLTFSDLRGEASFTWLKEGYDAYQPDAAAMGKLATLRNYRMVVFLGTWCDDSHNLVPKLEKVLDALSYPPDHIVMYGVDRAKETREGEQKKYGVTLVPTIILFDPSMKEAGRITESVKTSIEQDLVDIISK